MSEFDVIVIGGGPGGYVAAIRAAQLGLKTACVESRGALGGTCLNVGCIPSKALLQSSEVFANIKNHGEEHGIKATGLSVDLKQMMTRKTGIVSQLTNGIKGLFKKNKVTYLQGHGSFVDNNTVKVDGKDSGNYKAKNIIIATGSVPIELAKIAKFDGKTVVNSTDALSFEKVPKTLAVIGGGVIGLEMGSVWSRLGTKVTVIEAADTILSTMDQDISREMTKVMKKQGLDIQTSTMLQEIKVLKSKAQLTCKRGDETVEFEAEKVLVCVGRRANTHKLGLDVVGISTDDRGRVIVDDHMRTSHANIYAVGDVIRGPMLAHKAEDEGVAVAEIIAGQAGHVNYATIPGVVYTWPEIASVGKTQKECKDAGIEVKIGKFPFAANGRAKCAGETTGFVKVIADAKTDEMLGVHMLGANASELIGEAVVAMEFKASAEDLARSVHAHPTLSEAIKEAATKYFLY